MSWVGRVMIGRVRVGVEWGRGFGGLGELRLGGRGGVREIGVRKSCRGSWGQGGLMTLPTPTPPTPKKFGLKRSPLNIAGS